MEQKALDNDLKMLSSYISSALKSLEIWAQVYEITNPITEFRLKAKKVLAILYVGLVLLNFLFLMIFGYNATTNDDGLLLKILQFLLCFFYYSWYFMLTLNRLCIYFVLLHNHRL